MKITDLKLACGEYASKKGGAACTPSEQQLEQRHMNQGSGNSEARSKLARITRESAKTPQHQLLLGKQAKKSG